MEHERSQMTRRFIPPIIRAIADSYRAGVVLQPLKRRWHSMVQIHGLPDTSHTHASSTIHWPQRE